MIIIKVLCGTLLTNGENKMIWAKLIPIIAEVAGRNSQGLQKLVKGWNTAKQLNSAFNGGKGGKEMGDKIG